MNEYDFELKFSLPNPETDPEQFLNALYEAGCDDATVGLGQKGRVALSFTREAPSAQDAVTSAIANVTKAIPGAKLIEATPDYVGVTDIADFVGCSRQNIRKILISNSLAPTPVHSGSTVIWHLANVLDWLKHKGSYKIEDRLIELSIVTMNFNIEKEAARVGRNPRTGATIKIKAAKRQEQPSKRALA
jgi:hypothetical protein